MSRDRLYTDHPATPFEFSEQVVRIFPDMIRRSVPGYPLLLDMTGMMARAAVEPGTRVYDLGCSLGAATLAARRSIQSENVEIVAIDNAPAMVARAREVIAADNSRVPVRVLEGDIREAAIENASLVMMYFTLQFVAPEDREGVLRRIALGLNPGGVLLLAEKLAFKDGFEESWLTERHHDFKRARGYSDLEIARKRQALENVLIPETRAEHHARLKAAGFNEVVDWFQCLNFACIAAFK